MNIKILLFTLVTICVLHVINARPQEDFVFPDNEETEDRYGNRPNRPNRPGSGGRPFNPDYPTNPSRPNRPVRPVRPPPNRPTPTQPPVVPDGSATRPSICETNCLTTPQYNPVCGTDMVTYNNIGRLDCAARCGKKVQLSFMGRCQAIGK